VTSMAKPGDLTMNKRRSGRKNYALFYGEYERLQARRTQSLGLVLRSKFKDRTRNLKGLAKRNRNPDGNVAGATFINVNIDIQSKPREEENIFASGPAVFKGAKGIIFEGTIVSQGAFSAVGGSMYIGCTPEASTSSDSDATPRHFIPSVMEDAEDVHFKPGTQVEQGAMSAVRRNMVIGSRK